VSQLSNENIWCHNCQVDNHTTRSCSYRRPPTHPPLQPIAPSVQFALPQTCAHCGRSHATDRCPTHSHLENPTGPMIDGRRLQI
jgi:hypothetical protein